MINKKQTIACIAMMIALLWALPNLSSAQKVFYYDGKGAIDILTSWGSNPNGTGTNPASFSTAGLTYYFSGNNGTKSVTLPSTFYAKGTGTKVIDSLGVNLIVAFGLDSATTISVSDSSWLTLQDTVNVKLGTLKPTSTVAYDGSNKLNILAGTYGNLMSTNDVGSERKIPKRTITIVGSFDPGKASFIDSGTITFKGTSIQHVPTFNYLNLTVTNAASAVIDSGAVVTIATGGKLTISTGDSLIVSPDANLVYASKTAPTLTGSLHVYNGGTFTIKNNLAAVPTALFDSTSTVVIGDGVDTLTVLPKLSAKVSYGNMIINAPGVTSSVGSRLLPNTAGTYNITGDFTVLAGRVTNSNSGTKVVAKTLAIGGNLVMSGGVYTICDSSLASQNTMVSGSVLVSGGALFATNNNIDTLTGKGTLSVDGDLLHTGGLFGNASTSKLGGRIVFSTPDTAGQALSTIGFNNDKIAPLRLEVSGGNEVEVSSDVTVNDTLIITSGYFTVTAGNTLTINNSVKGYTDSSYVITDAAVDSVGKGIVRFNNIPANSWFIMPIGNDSTFQPITVKTIDSAASFSVTTYNGVTKDGTALGGAIQNVSNLVNTTWHIARNDGGKSPVLTQFNWNALMVGSSFAALADNQIAVYQNSGVGGLKPIATVASNAADSAVVTLTSFGDFMIAGTNLPLPVHFVNVTAAERDGAITVDWKTANETGIASYSVEKATDGLSFTSIASITAKKATANSYTFSDGNVTAANYYRIKAVSVSGEATYSSIVKVSGLASFVKSANVYPNPVVNKTINVALTNQKAAIYTIRLANNNGQLLFSKQINHSGGSSVTALDISQIKATGAYLLTISSEEEQVTKIVLVK